MGVERQADIGPGLISETEVDAEPTVQGGAREGRELSEKRRDRLFLLIVLLAIAGYFALFAALSLLRYSNFRAPGVDIAIFDQVLWSLSKFKGATSTIRGMNLFGDHMAPILFFLVPLYWVKGNVYALLIVQTAALALGALPIYLIAKDRLENRGLATILAISYLLYPALQNMNLFDFHPETLGVCFLLFAFLALEKRRFNWFYLLCLGALICKEDMALAVLLLGLLAYLKYDRRAGRLVAWGSAFYFLISVLFIVPRLGPEGFQYSGRLQQFGESPLEAAKNIVFRPRTTFSVVATRQNLRMIFDLLLPVGFLCLLSPLFLLPALPAFLANLLSDFPGQHTILFQYTAAIIPFVFIALIFALRKVKNWSEGGFRPGFVMGATVFVVLACAMAGSFYSGPSPLSETWSMAKYRSDAHIEVIREGLDLIGEDASVSSQLYMLPHLSERERIYMYPQPFVDLVDQEYFDSLDEDQRKYMWPGIYKRREKGEDPSDYPVPEVDYVVLDEGVDPWPLEADQYDKMLKRLLELDEFETVYDRQGVIIIERTDT